MTSTVVYASTAEFFARVNFTPDAVPNATETANALAFLQAVSRALDRWANAQDGFIALGAGAGTSRIYAGSGNAVQKIDRCVSVSLVEMKDSATDSVYRALVAGDWILFAGDIETPNFNEGPFQYLMMDPTGDESIFTSGRFITTQGFRPLRETIRRRGVPTVRVTARWGQFATAAEIPQIKEATLMQAAIYYKRLQGSGADTIADADFGALVFRKGIDPAVQALLFGARMTRPSIG